MKDLTDKPKVGIDFESGTGQFSIVADNNLLGLRHSRWVENSYDEQFWDRRLA